jgi:hypothetical protein
VGEKNGTDGKTIDSKRVEVDGDEKERRKEGR